MFAPIFDRNLDTANLTAYYKQHKPKNHPEKILIFAHFLKEELKVKPILGSDIFTWYTAMKSETKTRRRSPQALRDAESKHHVIDLKSMDDIAIPIAGTNYFHDTLERRVLSGRGR